jgi:hypothetical protein
LNVHEIKNQAFNIGKTSITPIEVLHYKLPVYGFRINDFTYITDANFILDGGVPINIYSLMDSYDWPFTSTNPLNLTTDLWTSTIPLFEDMVYTVDYSVTYTPGVSPVVVTTQNLLLVDCQTCCCVSKKTLSIDMNDTDTMVALLIPTAYLQAAQFAADNGLVDTANTFIAKAKKLCDQSKCGCGC